jgi:hypothetical protein
MPLFGDVESMGLKLKEAVTFDRGSVALRYVP